MAKYMCHSSSVQQAMYNEMIGTTKSVRLSNIIGKMLTNKTITHEDLTEAEFGKICTNDFIGNKKL